MSQGILQGKITRYAGSPEKLKDLMDGKTKEQKRLGRSHLKTVQALMGLGNEQKQILGTGRC